MRLDHDEGPADAASCILPDKLRTLLLVTIGPPRSIFFDAATAWTKKWKNHPSEKIEMDRIAALFGANAPAPRDALKYAFGAAFVGLAAFSAFKFLRYRSITVRTVSVTLRDRSRARCAGLLGPLIVFRLDLLAAEAR